MTDDHLVDDQPPTVEPHLWSLGVEGRYEDPLVFDTDDRGVHLVTIVEVDANNVVVVQPILNGARDLGGARRAAEYNAAALQIWFAHRVRVHAAASAGMEVARTLAGAVSNDHAHRMPACPVPCSFAKSVRQPGNCHVSIVAGQQRVQA